MVLLTALASEEPLRIGRPTWPEVREDSLRDSFLLFGMISKIKIQNRIAKLWRAATILLLFPSQVNAFVCVCWLGWILGRRRESSSWKLIPVLNQRQCQVTGSRTAQHPVVNPFCFHLRLSELCCPRYCFEEVGCNQRNLIKYI